MYQAMKLGRISAPLPSGLPTLDGHPIRSATALPALDRSGIAFTPTMGGNDICSDCTCVALANAILAQAALEGWGMEIHDESVIGLYRAVTEAENGLAYTADNPFSDSGLVEVSLLQYQAEHGFDVAQQTPYVGLWANVPADDINMLRLVTERMGCAYLGIELAEADQVGGELWDTNTPASYGDPAPGSWGPHGLLAWSYDNRAADDDPASVWELATWGGIQRCTTRWLKSRLVETHAVYHPQMIGPGARNPAGLDRERLAADVASFGAVA